jgi:predicted secreted protein
VLEQDGQPGFEPDSEAHGAGGTFTFRFRVVAPGNALLKLIYSRPWDKDKAAAQTWHVTIKAAREGTYSMK